MNSLLIIFFRHTLLSARFIGFVLFTPFFICCSEADLEKSEQILKTVSEDVIASVGDTLTTSDRLSLIIPAGALLEDGSVFLGRTGNEPTTVPNQDLKVVGEPVTIQLPQVLINIPLLLSMPIGSMPVDENNFLISLYDGKSYIPLKFTIHSDHIVIQIDIADWEETNVILPKSISELVILAMVNKQTPSEEEKGLKKISIDPEGNMTYDTPSVNSSSKVLLMVHGWLANSSRWINFMQDIQSQDNELYSEYWTFNYNSSWSIEQNAELLFEALEKYSNGAEIDIVAHSMGGLVSRSMLETFQGHKYINRLVTLGSPHLGSPLAAFRNVIGAIISMDNAEDGMLYNYYSQGFRDLDVDSDFINKMKELEKPPIPYYTIACQNNAQTSYAILASEMLEGFDDGVVEVASAKGIPRAEKADNDITINTDFAHLEIPDNDLVFQQVMDFLCSE